MATKLKREHVENALNSFKANNPELKDFTLQNADGRLGKRIALAKIGELGRVSIKTDFMTYSEMNMFLLGYSFKADNRFGGKY